MFNDILGNDKKLEMEEDKDSIIDALRYNVEEKQKMIEDLVRQVTDLERLLEEQHNDVSAGI
jgi:hypothetical protein